MSAVVPSVALPDPSSSAACRDWLADLAMHQLGAFRDNVPIGQLLAERANAVDGLLTSLWQYHCEALPQACLVAVGGYGRGELHPHSDIDLTILVAERPTAAAEASVTAFLTALWDLKLDIGHSVRTIDDCVAESKVDVAVLTTLMESRCLIGPPELHDKMNRALSARRLWSGRDYFEAKYAEQQQRHARYGDTSYTLEPSIKGSPGGLRDIQMVGWVAKRHYDVDTLADLIGVGFLTADEYAALSDGQDFLWRVRFVLHNLAGRREDRLLFDLQRETARLFGYSEEEGSNRAVEQFMQRYYRVIQQLQRLNEVLLQTMQEDILGLRSSRSVLLGDELQLQGDYLGIANEDAFERRPALLLEIFRELQRRTFLKGLRAATIRAMDRALPLIDDSFRSQLEHRAIFMQILRDGTRLPKILHWMHRYGVLGAYLPVFARVTGRMQFDLFHLYTVDYHTLRVVGEAHSLLHDELDKSRFPLAKSVAQRLKKPFLLLIACFFHDVAKGRGGDHSELGEIEVAQFAHDHGLSASETELLRFLVRHHLIMSVTAQKKDIADPEVVNAFAQEVGNQTYLNYLYLLTVADICGTNPKLWNRWKANLMADLYRLTRAALRRGLENPLRRSQIATDTRVEAQAELADTLTADQIQAVWALLPESYFVRHSAGQISWHTPALASSPELPLVLTRNNQQRHVTELLIYAENIDGTFAAIVDALDRNRATVVDAKIFNTADGRIVDSFELLDAAGTMIGDPSSLAEAVAVALRPRPLRTEARRGRLSRRMREFRRPPSIRFDPAPSDNRTLMELICLDQPGLLARVAKVLLAFRARVHDARIATFGERAEDYFWLSDQDDQPLDETTQKQIRRTLQDELTSAE